MLLKVTIDNVGVPFLRHSVHNSLTKSERSINQSFTISQ